MKNFRKGKCLFELILLFNIVFYAKIKRNWWNIKFRCVAKCNGEYNGRWSKTMVGYGPEDDYFAIELTYNYKVKDYDNGKL